MEQLHLPNKVISEAIVWKLVFNSEPILNCVFNTLDYGICMVEIFCMARIVRLYEASWSPRFLVVHKPFVRPLFPWDCVGFRDEGWCLHEASGVFFGRMCPEVVRKIGWVSSLIPQLISIFCRSGNKKDASLFLFGTIWKRGAVFQLLQMKRGAHFSNYAPVNQPSND